jgi:hypothetical protein
MAKRNQHTSIVENTCPVCGAPKGSFLVARQARFKANKPHTDGEQCENCARNISEMAAQLEAGGTLCQCKGGAISVVMEIPEDLKPFASQLPYGGFRLEVPECSLCKKEAANAPAPEVPGPDLGS